MASIYFIRHGQASFGSDNYDQLSPLGQRQADLSGEYFGKIGQTFDAAFSGDLSRQRETGERVLAGCAPGMALQVDSRFNEIDNDDQVKKLLPVLTARDEKLAAIAERGFKSSKDYQKIIDAVFNAWVSPDCPEVGLVPWSQFRDDVYDAVRNIVVSVGSGKDTAVFSSGGTIATAVGLVLGVHSSGFYQFYEPMMNCSITRMIYSSARISLSNFNDVSHLHLMGAQLGETLVTYR